MDTWNLEYLGEAHPGEEKNAKKTTEGFRV